MEGLTRVRRRHYYTRHTRRFLTNFLCRFPVMSVVSLPNGTVVSKMNANDLMERQSGEEM